MGLTLYWEKNLRDAGLDAFFTQNRPAWLAAARDAIQYARTSFPNGGVIRRDDVAQFLIPVIEVDDDFKNYLDANRLTQKYWARHFADMVIDYTWNEISNQGAPA
jgi:hypothetical protein